MSYSITENVDARGLNCPLPILRIKKAISAVKAGEAVKMYATDPGSIKDVEAFCKQTGNELLHSGEDSGAFEFVVNKSQVS